eukprot:6492573-Amphidinium_carterae.5
MIARLAHPTFELTMEQCFQIMCFRELFRPLFHRRLVKITPTMSLKCNTVCVVSVVSRANFRDKIIVPEVGL